MSQISFFELIGRSMVEFAPDLKQIDIDRALVGAIRELVSGANYAALELGILTSDDLGLSETDGASSPFAIAVVDETELLTLSKQANSRLYCDEARLFWAVSRNEEPALLPFRTSRRLIVAPNGLEDASNETSYLRVMNMTSVLSATPIQMLTVTHEVLAQIITNELLALAADSPFVSQVREQLSYSVRVIAESYRALPRTGRLSQGGLYLKHLELAYERLRIVAANQPDPSRVAEHLADSVFPSFSLPTPANGSYFDPDAVSVRAGEGIGVQISATIRKHWEDGDKILESSGHIQLARAVDSHPNSAPAVELLNWPWHSYDQERDTSAYGSPLLGWQQFNNGVLTRNLAFFSRSAPDGLSESEFFSPKPDAVQLDGIWSDGSPLIEKSLSTKIAISPSHAVSGETLIFRSPEMTFYVPVVPAAVFSQAQLLSINLDFEKCSSLCFEVGSRVHNIAEERIEITGHVVAECETIDSDYSFKPTICGLSVKHPQGLFQVVIPTLECRVILLPPEGSGYLIGAGLAYRGPTQFDASASPINQAVEYEWELSDGETIRLIAWSSSLPTAIEILDGSVQNLPVQTTKHVIRWVGELQAQGADFELVQRGV